MPINGTFHETTSDGDFSGCYVKLGNLVVGIFVNRLPRTAVDLWDIAGRGYRTMTRHETTSNGRFSGRALKLGRVTVGVGWNRLSGDAVPKSTEDSQEGS